LLLIGSRELIYNPQTVADDELKELKSRIHDLESKVSALETTKAVGAAIALAFGITTGWGLRVINTAESKVQTIRQEVSQLDNEVASKKNAIDSSLASLKAELANGDARPLGQTAACLQQCGGGGSAIHLAVKAKQFTRAAQNLRAQTPAAPYAWVGYNDDLRKLAEVFNTYLGYLRLFNEPISLSEGKAFVDDLRNAAHDAQLRAKDQLPQPDRFRDTHVNKNFTDFEIMLDHLETDFQANGNGRLTPDQIRSFDLAIPDWLNKAVV
jgi:polyhydroxyalkanoate synthesis regulator phasin